MQHAELANKLSALPRDDLNVLARRFKVPKFRAMPKEELVETLLATDVDALTAAFGLSWWQRYHNHV